MDHVKRCDRCGKSYDHYPNRNHLGKYNSMRFVMISDLKTIVRESSRIDLCPQCIEHLYSWFVNSESEENKQ